MMGMKRLNRDSLNELLGDSRYKDEVGLALGDVYDYANFVMRLEDEKRAAAVRYEAAEYREEIQRLDRQRRALHDAAMGALSLLNRIAANVGVEPVYSGEENRGDMAGAIFDYCKSKFDADIYG
jgi:hypothetical protein